MTDEEVGRKIVDAALKVHKRLGIGLLNKVYEAFLAFELEKKGLKTEHRHMLPTRGDTGADQESEAGLLVADAVMVKLVKTQKDSLQQRTRVISYMRLARIKLGFMINFNTPQLKTGITRLVP